MEENPSEDVRDGTDNELKTRSCSAPEEGSILPHLTSRTNSADRSGSLGSDRRTRRLSKFLSADVVHFGPRDLQKELKGSLSATSEHVISDDASPQIENDHQIPDDHIFPDYHRRTPRTSYILEETTTSTVETTSGTNPPSIVYTRIPTASDFGLNPTSEEPLKLSSGTEEDMYRRIPAPSEIGMDLSGGSSSSSMPTSPKPKVKSYPSLHAFLQNPENYHLLKTFLKKEFSSENLSFWKIYQKFRVLDWEQRDVCVQNADLIYTKFIVENSRKELNIPFHARQKIKEVIEKKEHNAKMYEEVYYHIIDNIEKDGYMRFMQSQKGTLTEKTLTQTPSSSEKPALADNLRKSFLMPGKKLLGLIKRDSDLNRSSSPEPSSPEVSERNST